MTEIEETKRKVYLSEIMSILESEKISIEKLAKIKKIFTTAPEETPFDRYSQYD